MLLTTLHILTTVSVAIGVRINGSSSSIMASGSVTQIRRTDVAETSSEITWATTSSLNIASHAVLARQRRKHRRNAFSPDVVPASFSNVSHEIQDGGWKLEKVDSQIVLKMPLGKECTLNTAQQLGAGGFGSVYACGDQIAVKFVKKELSSERPEEEFQRQHKVISKYVVDAKGMFRISGNLQWATTDLEGKAIHESIRRQTLCIVQEKMGNSLLKLLMEQEEAQKEELEGNEKRSNEWIEGNPEITKRIWAMVLVGIMRIHQQNMMFRDLKLENILCGEGNTNEMIVKITDFGLATDHYQNPPKLQQGYVGTVDYMAPEIVSLRGCLPDCGYTAAADAWALGVLLCEMYFGYAPFWGRTDVEVLKKIAAKDQNHFAEYPDEKVNTLPPSMKNLIVNLLQKDPTKRRCIRESADCCVKESDKCPKNKVRGLISDHPWVKTMVDSLMDADTEFIKLRMAERAAELKDAERWVKEERAKRKAEKQQAEKLKMTAWLKTNGFKGNDVNEVRTGGKDGKSKRDKKCPLHAAIKLKDENMVRILLANKADLKCADDRKKTPLALALQYQSNRGPLGHYKPREKKLLDRIIKLLRPPL